MLDDKDLEKDWGKNDKKMDVEFGPIEEKEKELFEKFWIVKTRGNSWKKKLSKQILIDRKTDLIDRKLHSIDRARQIQTKILITISIDWKSGKIKFLKIKAF